jgi:CheY-like chemotaxis protein
MAIKTLVVDNNPVLLKAVSTILSQEGCTVKSAGTGLEALEILQDYEPEVVVTDLIMPLVSGEQLCRILRHTKKHQDIFIVVLSATILEDHQRIIEEINCDLCIAKGNLKEMRRHIREALDTFRARKATPPSKNKTDARIPAGLKRSEVTHELLLEKRHLAMIVANLDEGILELSSQGKVVAANHSALEMLSSREELLIGLTLPEAIDWGQLASPIRQWTEHQLIARGMGGYKIFEDSPLQLGGRIIIGSFFPVAEEEDVFGLCILRDITRQFQAEQHTREQDNAFRLIKKMDAMSCMAGGVAHDFNNLLTVICGNLDIILHHGKSQSSTDRAKLIAQARKAALVAADLTRQISCFSNFGIVSRENVRIGQLVRIAVERFFENEPGDYTLTTDGEDCLVSVDPEEISQAIGNVLKNGIEASDGGTIEVVISKSIFATPQLMSGQYVSAGTYARIDLHDFGRGIGRDQLFQIFDPYYSTKERGALKGMGLGLTVVYATLRNHGGHVVVSSKPAVGTTVSLYLPVAAAKDGQPIFRKKGGVGGRSVLLIEPDRQMREIGTIMLEHLGFSVAKAANRGEAVEHLQRVVGNPPLPRPLVILDLSDANGELAVETCRLLHMIVPELRIIAMSGTILDPVMADCRPYGFVNTLAKPYSIDSLKHITGMAISS